MDVATKSRHAGRVGEKKQYWDYRECGWVRYESPLAEIPEQVEPADQLTPVDAASEADVRSG